MFDCKKPTVQMLGRWQPWHEGHTRLFQKALTITGQVVIMIRDVEGVDAGMGNTDNPFNSYEVKVNIILAVLDIKTKSIMELVWVIKINIIMEEKNIVNH